MSSAPQPRMIVEVERDAIVAALRYTHGDKTRASGPRAHGPFWTAASRRGSAKSRKPVSGILVRRFRFPAGGWRRMKLSTLGTR